jgi:hypothetical protein
MFLQHRDRGQDLVVATHVCRHWRSTLISNATLWTSIQLRFIHEVDRILTYLERSKSATIDIKINLRSLEDLGVLQHFAPHISRTRSFVVEGFSNVSTTSSLLLCEPVPSLEYLWMCAAREDPVCAPDNFLGQQAPSLRSASFIGIWPIPEPFFPLPSLTELVVSLPRYRDPFRISLLFRLFSNCPRLQQARISIECNIINDVALDRVVLLDSLVKLEYTCKTVGRFIPFLKLPLLKSLRVSLGTRGVYQLASMLPHGAHNLLSGATTMSLFYRGGSQAVELSGNGVNASFTVSDDGMGATSAGWFSDDTYIPFGQIENLEFGGYQISADFPLHLFKKLTRFRVNPGNERVAAGVLWLLHPNPGVGTPCPSLQEITYTLTPPTPPTVMYMKPLVNLARERERAGYQLELVCMLATQLDDQQFDPDLKEELREHVRELRVDVSG